MNRTYAVLEIRSVKDDERIIEGIATTQELALDGLILETHGIDFKLPIPFLLHHDQKRPIGNVIDAKRTSEGILVRIRIGPAGTADYIDEAWRIIKAGVVRGLSITWSTVKRTGNRITKSIWLELSAVSVPADMNATILSVRSADEAILAASGTRERQSAVRLNTNSPASGLAKGKAMITKNIGYTDHIAALETKRAANDEKMDAIMQKCKDEARSRDASEMEEFNNLQAEQRALDTDIKDFQEREASLAARIAAAKPVVASQERAVTDPEKAGKEQRQGIIEVGRRNQPQGIGVARMAIAMVRANNNPELAAQMARKYWPDSPEVEHSLRAVIEAGDTTTSGWASQLVPSAQQMQDEFLELFRPATILGRIPVRKVPFNISVPIETASGTVAWVGEGAPKPVTKLTLSSVTLRWAKAAAIVVITKELAKFSRPDAELVVRDSMVKTLVRFFDSQFVGSAAEVSNVSPAGILNGKSATTVTAATAAAFRLNMNTMLATMSAANVPFDNLVLLMSGTQAVALSLMVTDLGVPLFPNIDRSGGTLLGFPVIISEAVGTKIIALNASDVLLAADPGVSVDVSDTASVEMDDAPTVGESSPVTSITTLKSFWQNNLIGIRVEQFITWKLARAASVEFLSPVAYLP